MEIIIIRVCHPVATNGRLYVNGSFQCYTIELPWHNNRPKSSCIPAGTYQLTTRWSLKHGHHLWVTGVPGRSLILFHPANDAIKQLQGCIAPVRTLTGMGRGSGSRQACRNLYNMVAAATQSETVLLTIKNK